jgi:hypothetical protein
VAIAFVLRTRTDADKAITTTTKCHPVDMRKGSFQTIGDSGNASDEADERA